jgi:hypothetical protein
MSDKYETVFTTVVDGTDRRMVKDGTLAIYDVFTQDGTQWSTFKAELYDRARRLQGQTADWKGVIEQKENFTNRTLIAIRPHQDGFEADGNAGTQERPSQGRQAAERAQVAQVEYGDYKAVAEAQELRKQESIHRQTAGKVAAEISNDPAEFWDNVQSIKTYFDSGVVPLPYARQSSVKSHAGDEPIPQADEAPDGWADPDEDIPF